MILLPFVLAAAVEPDDAELAERLERRDPRALGDLYDRYGRLVFSLLVRIIGNAAVAEDLAGEVFLRAWIVVTRRGAARAGLAAWLLEEARRRALEYLGNGRGGAVAELATEFGQLPAGGMERIRAAMRTLPDSQRRAVELAWFAGLTPAGIAEEMKETVAAVKESLRSALAMLDEATR